MSGSQPPTTPYQTRKHWWGAWRAWTLGVSWLLLGLLGVSLLATASGFPRPVVTHGLQLLVLCLTLPIVLGAATRVGNPTCVWMWRVAAGGLGIELVLRCVALLAQGIAVPTPTLRAVCTLAAIGLIGVRAVAWTQVDRPIVASLVQLLLDLLLLAAIGLRVLEGDATTPTTLWEVAPLLLLQTGTAILALIACCGLFAEGQRGGAWLVLALLARFSSEGVMLLAGSTGGGASWTLLGQPAYALSWIALATAAAYGTHGSPPMTPPVAVWAAVTWRRATLPGVLAWLSLAAALGTGTPGTSVHLAVVLLGVSHELLVRWRQHQASRAIAVDRDQQHAAAAARGCGRAGAH